MTPQYNLNKLLELAKDFYSLTGVKCCIYDRNENELCFYPEKLSSFCRLLRNDEEMDTKCRACDKRGFAECRKSKSQYTYTCHAGLLECVSPIVYNDSIIGYLAIGQVKALGASLPAFLRESDTDGRLVWEYDKLPVIPVEKINSSIRLMDACTGYEYLRGLATLADGTIDSRIMDHVSANLTRDLSVRALCAHFRVSHNEMYAIFKDYFGTTPAAYVKDRRIAYACQLLRNTELAVSDIAERCGIPDYNYFSKQFKSAVGTSPSAYRKGFNIKENI